jgi:hypothetical protein
MADKDQKSASHLSPFDDIRHVDEQLRRIPERKKVVQDMRLYGVEKFP